MKLKVAVIGATGAVGRELLKTLAERHFPASEVVALASSRSIGKQVSFGEEQILTAQALEHYDFTGTHIAFFAAGSDCSKIYAPIAAAAGAIVIDKSSHYRLDSDIPLLVPEVNLHRISLYEKKRIIANPNCVAVPIAMVLKPILDQYGIKRVVASTYQSVSGQGRHGMDELFRQTKAIMVGDPVESQNFPKQIAFNLIPQCDQFMEDGSTVEEFKVHAETCKILEKEIPMAVTCVRVPVFIGHSMALAIECEKPFVIKELRNLLQKTAGLNVYDAPAQEHYITPLETVGEDEIFISRIRMDQSIRNGVLLWISSDNLRKGASLNAVQIAENLLDYF